MSGWQHSNFCPDRLLANDMRSASAARFDEFVRGISDKPQLNVRP
jgi:hypothetical protein